MRIKSFILAFALVSPGAALAQSGNSGRPMALEIVGTGGVDVKPGRVILTLQYCGEGKTQAEAERALAAKLDKARQVLKAEGIDAAAISDPTPKEATKLIPDSCTPAESDDMASDAADTTKPMVSVPGIKKLTVARVDQAEALTVKLLAVDVKADDMTIEPDIAGIDAARRQAKALALRAARSDAEIYAKEMGLRVSRVVRISETGNGPLMPGIQAKLEQAVMQGPKALAYMFKRPDGSARIDTSIIVEFELAK